jgi:hypothetical protein
MISFSEALSAGLSNAKKLNEDKSKINEKLDEIKYQIQAITEATVSLSIERDEKIPSFITNPSDFRVFLVRNRPSAIKHELAYWSQHPQTGFPCKLKYYNNLWICENIHEIEAAFSELVQEVTVSSIIYSMMIGN